VKQSYSEERRSAVLSKLLPPQNRSVLQVSQEERISVGTLYHWLEKAKMKGEVVPGNKKTTDAWSAEARLAVVIEVAALSAAEFSQYCREKGLYVEQVSAWREACLDGQRSAGEQRVAEREELRVGKKRIRELERELRQKEKALAEVAALLVLRKKFNALWGNDNEVN
jgi:transposase-like protein